MAILTNATNNNSGWEVAGGKKNARKSPDLKNKSKNSSTDLSAKMPKIENLAPLQLKGSIYDNLRESDDSSDEMDTINNNRVNKKLQSDVRMPSLIQTELKQKAATASPKAQQKNSNKPQAETLNLLQTSIATNKKKVASPSAGKNVQVEFEKAVGQLRVEDLEKEYGNLANIFQANFLLINQHLASILNQKLNHVTDLDPSVSHENDLTDPVAKLDKKVVKFLNGLITKLNRNDGETLFDFCFDSLFSESSRTQSVHGYKIIIQLLVKHLPNLIATNNLNRYATVIHNNKHKPQRCLIALWALGQVGYYNLSNGVKTWFDCMLPFVQIKNCPNYVVTYLSAIFSHHKIDLKSIDKLPEQFVNLDQYLRLYEFMSEKLVLSKDALQRLKESFEIVRGWFMQDLTSQKSAVQYFETLFKNLPLESSSKQSEFLYMLNQIVLTQNQNVLNKWKDSYAKNLHQSLALVESLSQVKNLTKYKQLKETLRFFEQQTSQLLLKLNPSGQKESKSHHRVKSKSSETETLRRFNDLIKSLIGSQRSSSGQQGGRASPFKMAFRTLFFLLLTTAIFFYWDVNQNKSLYTNSVKKELGRYEGLKPVQDLVTSGQKLAVDVKKKAHYYVPIYYKKASDTVGPYVRQGSKLVREYSNLVWTKSQPIRDQALVYVNQGVDYVHENFPALVKNLVSVYELVLNYFTTVGNFVLYYTSQGLDFVGTQLLSMKKGELEHMFVDAFKYSINYATRQLQQFNNYLNKN